MVIRQVSQAEIVETVAGSLALPPAITNGDREAFLDAVIRRIAGARCPCSAATLVSVAVETLQTILPGESLNERLQQIVESLVVIGDLLELSDVTLDDPDIKGTWLFIAPPSFVARPNESIIVTGISPDEPTALPESLHARIHYEGVARILYPATGENLPSVLRDLGLVELSYSHWLRAPAQTTAQSFLDQMAKRLASRTRSGAIDDLTILLPNASVTHYRNRWTKPTDQTGSFVARRPQAYGAPLWGFVQLENGTPVQFLDFPMKEYPYRGCDVAWHLQMAIDASRSTPQQYRVRGTMEGPCVDVFSPLPLWADRRLRVLGRQEISKDCLMSYRLSEPQLGTEEQFLQNHLWLTRMPNE